MADLVAYLASSGAEVEVVCTPELRPDCAWTNDWMLHVDGVVWLVEHTALMYRSRSTPRLRETHTRLRAFLEEAGRRHSVRIAAIVSPDIDNSHLDRKAAKRARRDAYSRLKQFVPASLESMDSSDAKWIARDFEDGCGNSIHVLRLDPSETHENLGYGSTGSSMAGTSDLQEQFDRDIAPVVRRKLLKQIRKQAGSVEHAGLFLDQFDGDGVVNSVLSPEGVRQGIVQICQDFPDVLDRVWMRTRDGRVLELDLDAPVPERS